MVSLTVIFSGESRADSRFAPSQWETALLCKDVSHWLGASQETALRVLSECYKVVVSLQDSLYSSCYCLWHVSLIGKLELLSVMYLSRVSCQNGPYLPCVSMAGGALLAGYHRYVTTTQDHLTYHYWWLIFEHLTFCFIWLYGIILCEPTFLLTHWDMFMVIRHWVRWCIYKLASLANVIFNLLFVITWNNGCWLWNKFQL